MRSAQHAPGRFGRLFRAGAVAATTAVLSLGALPAAQAGGDPLAGHILTGRLVQAYPESRAEDAALAEAPLSWLQPPSGTPVRVDTADVAHVPAGSKVRLTMGGSVDDGADPNVGTAHEVTHSVVIGAPDSTPAAGPAPGDLTDRVTVVLVEAGGGTPDATTAQDLLATVNGPVHDFWRDQTDGAVRLGVVATRGWVSTTATCSTPTSLWDEAATAAGFTPGPGNHLVVYLSSRSAGIGNCSYGLSEVGSGLGSGGRLYVQDTLPSLIAHELGHNFGLGHSSGRQCDSAVDTGSCQTQPYRDYYDVMGASWEHVGTLNAAQEARLGVLPAAQKRTVTATGPGATVTLAPISGRAGVRALELTAADGTDYWVEYRPPAGQDAWLGTAEDRLGLEPGVLLHRSGAMPDTALLLDGTPSATAAWADDLQAALPVGTPVALADGFTVTVGSVGPAGASLSVTTSPPAAATSASPSSAPRPRTLPGNGSGNGAGGGTGGTGAGTDGAAATPPGPAGILRYSIPAAQPPAQPAPAQAGEMTLASLTSPTTLTATGALVIGAALLGLVLARRRRSRSLRSRSGDPAP